MNRTERARVCHGVRRLEKKRVPWSDERERLKGYAKLESLSQEGRFFDFQLWGFEIEEINNALKRGGKNEVLNARARQGGRKRAFQVRQSFVGLEHVQALGKKGEGDENSCGRGGLLSKHTEG